MQVEATLGGRLLDKPKNILFQFGGGNLCLSIEDLSPCWQCKMSANCQVGVVDGLMDGWMDGWMGLWMGGQMDGRIVM